MTVFRNNSRWCCIDSGMLGLNQVGYMKTMLHPLCSFFGPKKFNLTLLLQILLKRHSLDNISLTANLQKRSPFPNIWKTRNISRKNLNIYFLYRNSESVHNSLYITSIKKCCFFPQIDHLNEDYKMKPNQSYYLESQLLCEANFKFVDLINGYKNFKSKKIHLFKEEHLTVEIHVSPFHLLDLNIFASKSWSE